MKRKNISTLIGIWVTGALLFSGFPARAEEERVVHPVKPVQSERDLGSDRAPVAGTEDRGGGAGLNDVLQFESGRLKTPLPEREAETLRFHQNTLLDRFENTDAHGQLALSFSSDGAELKLRSITGAEAPIVGMNRSPKE